MVVRLEKLNHSTSKIQSSSVSSMLWEIASMSTQIKTTASDAAMITQVKSHGSIKIPLIKEAIIIDSVWISMKLFSIQKISM